MRDVRTRSFAQPALMSAGPKHHCAFDRVIIRHILRTGASLDDPGLDGQIPAARGEAVAQSHRGWAARLVHEVGERPVAVEARHDRHVEHAAGNSGVGSEQVNLIVPARLQGRPEISGGGSFKDGGAVSGTQLVRDAQTGQVARPGDVRDRPGAGDGGGRRRTVLHVDLLAPGDEREHQEEREREPRARRAHADSFR